MMTDLRHAIHHLSRAVLLGTCLVCLTTPGHAGKPGRNDPVRKDIVAAIRHHPAFDKLKSAKLDIRRIWASERFGYVCMLVIDQTGQHLRTDDAYNVHQIVLKHDNGKWTPVAQIEGLSESSKTVQCATDSHGDITDAFLEGVADNPRMAL